MVCRPYDGIRIPPRFNQGCFSQQQFDYRPRCPTPQFNVPCGPGPIRGPRNCGPTFFNNGGGGNWGGNFNLGNFNGMSNWGGLGNIGLGNIGYCQPPISDDALVAITGIRAQKSIALWGLAFGALGKGLESIPSIVSWFANRCQPQQDADPAADEAAKKAAEEEAAKKAAEEAAAKAAADEAAKKAAEEEAAKKAAEEKKQ